MVHSRLTERVFFVIEALFKAGDRPLRLYCSQGGIENTKVNEQLRAKSATEAVTIHFSQPL